MGVCGITVILYIGISEEFSSPQPKWQTSRLLPFDENLMYFFTPRYLMELTDTFGESADRLVENLASKADGKSEIKVMDELERVTLDVICKVNASICAGREFEL